MKMTFYFSSQKEHQLNLGKLNSKFPKARKNVFIFGKIKMHLNNTMKMDKYYIVINNEQKGPFTIDELKEQNIELSTLVWNEGMENWEEAKNVAELRNIIRISPPPIPKISDVTYKVEAEIKSKKEKLIKPETEIVVAKEIKTAYRLALYSLISIILTFPIFFNIEGGFKLLKTKKNLPDCHKVESDLREKLQSSQVYDSEFRDYVYDRIKYKEDIRKLLNSSSFWEKFSKIDSVAKANPIILSGYATKKYMECKEHAERVQSRVYECCFDALIKSLIASPIIAILLIIGRYVFKGVKWVDKTSKKAS